ncbi:unnamed protein product [Caenorhabditis angaria]|uniref:Serpentine receptor class r-10 n=1 Tax=Caenorhabditis angaria TaxID=860376 RepID=A0A9P1IMU5_9PELO|nr:unnamed protein product [Caenorhabditis angaria]
MKLNTWVNLQHQFEQFSSPCSFLINALLIWIIYHNSPVSIGAYKYLLMYISIFEILYAIINFTLQPIFISARSLYCIFVDVRGSTIDPGLMRVFISVYCAVFGASLGLFCIHFIYRYLAACQHKLLQTFNNWKIVFWLMIPMILAFIWSMISFLLAPPSDLKIKHIKNRIFEIFDLESKDIVYLAVFFYPIDPETGKQYTDPISVLSAVIAITSLFVSFGILLYFGLKCYKEIKKLVSSSSKSANYQNMQTQLFFALVVQTLIPCILMHIPCFLMILSALLNKDIGHLTGFVTITIALYPTIDPLPNLLIIKSYRKALKRYLGYYLIFKKNRLIDVEFVDVTVARTATIA